MISRILRNGFAGLSLLAVTTVVMADPPPDFTSNATLWINSNPVSLKQFAGKAVVLTFFEEDCPRCRAEMEARVGLSQKYADQPVFFVAINSGSPRREIETYVQQVGVTWPVILDPDRSYEKAMGINEISLNNIYQFRYVNAQGELRRGSSNDLDTIVQEALVGASWDVAPEKIPPSLKGAWSAVELRNYSAASVALTKAAKSRDEEVRTAAELLLAVVDEQVTSALESAKLAETSGNIWLAYTQYADIDSRFKGYAQADVAATEKKRLALDETVKTEISLARKIDGFVDTIQKRGPNPARIAALEKIATDNPNTAAAERVQGLLVQLRRQPSE